ncbi:hypothetical protein DV736_g475, partial [Chaetothyriales sp. CBS 134916]
MAPNSQPGHKRKADFQPSSRHAIKRHRPNIPVQHGHSGELNIAAFVKGREFEIQALESSMQKARKSLMSRAFQQVPRHMRRRTASHNVKKVPRRLRKRAEREMKMDNTPTVSKRTRSPSRKLRLRLQTAHALQKANRRSKAVRQRKKEAKANAAQADPDDHVRIRARRMPKNRLAHPPQATSKYKRRQVNKTWLPTHLWHAKRAHMTRPTEPLWRMAIPLSPTEKTYRPSHRAAASRGCIAWDTSYLSTVACQGTEHAVLNMLNALNFDTMAREGSKFQRWLTGSRFVEGWAHELDGEKRPLMPMSVLWIPQNEKIHVEGKDSEKALAPSQHKAHKNKLDRRILVRVHPAAFHIFWIELVKAAKLQKPQVLVEDLRYEIGSIQISGPGSTEALTGVLKPRHQTTPGSVEDVWAALSPISDPAALPPRCVLAFDVVDPRLVPRSQPTPAGPATFQRVNELIASWPLDSHPAVVHLGSYKHRWSASTLLPSQKAIHSRKAAAGKNQALDITEKDPAIPIMLLAHRSTSPGASKHGLWTVLLPWACTDVVWRSLVHHPLSSGGTPRFGGLYEHRQIAFERQIAWFPADMPGTEAGRAWERSESEKRFDEWMRRPSSRRLAWDKVDLGLGRRGEIGNGWSCDWEYLLSQSERKHHPDQVLTAESNIDVTAEIAPETGLQLPLMPGWIRKTKRRKQQQSQRNHERQRRQNTSSPEPDEDADKAIENILSVDYCQLTPSQAGALLKKDSRLPATAALMTVRIRLLTKGQPVAAARVYRLPIGSVVPSQAQVKLPALLSGRDSLAPTSSTAGFATGSSSSDTQSLSDKWMSLMPPDFLSGKSGLPVFQKQRHNHRGLPSKHTAYLYKPPDHISVLPKNAHQSIISKYGAQPLSEEEKQQREREALIAELMKGDLTPNEAWDANKGLVPCPDAHDLIGFVTSGGYNLALGCGSAVGGLWLQRIVQGWQEADALAATQAAGMKKTQRAKFIKQHDKVKHLCVVRNAGESIGRLGREICIDNVMVRLGSGFGARCGRRDDLLRVVGPPPCRRYISTYRRRKERIPVRVGGSGSVNLEYVASLSVVIFTRIDYRLSSGHTHSHTYTYPQPIHDVSTAFSHLVALTAPSLLLPPSAPAPPPPGQSWPRIVLVGSHIGASLAAMLALTHPDAIDAVVAIEPLWAGLAGNADIKHEELSDEGSEVLDEQGPESTESPTAYEGYDSTRTSNSSRTDTPHLPDAITDENCLLQRLRPVKRRKVLRRWPPNYPATAMSPLPPYFNIILIPPKASNSALPDMVPDEPTEPKAQRSMHALLHYQGAEFADLLKRVCFFGRESGIAEARIRLTEAKDANNADEQAVDAVKQLLSRPASP